MNNRRKLLVALGAGAFAAPFAAFAQQQGKVWRIGILLNGTGGAMRGLHAAFVHGLNELGYAEGKNVILETRWAEGKLDRIPALVAELLAQKLDVLFAPSSVAAQAAQESGTATPIVFALV